MKKLDDEGKPIKLTSFSLKPKKSKDPAPGSYEVVDAITKTQWPKNMYAFNKQKNNTFIGKRR